MYLVANSGFNTVRTSQNYRLELSEFIGSLEVNRLVNATQRNIGVTHFYEKLGGARLAR